jgi:hypothetical protein
MTKANRKLRRIGASASPGSWHSGRFGDWIAHFHPMRIDVRFLFAGGALVSNVIVLSVGSILSVESRSWRVSGKIRTIEIQSCLLAKF